MYFSYGEREKEYLKERDPILGRVIDHIGHIYREINPDLFASLVHQIVSQQISSAARNTVWGRMVESLGQVNPERILALGRDDLQALGISFRKADYIVDIASKVQENLVNLEELKGMSDKEVIKTLCQFKGIGPWTAEMALIFSMERPDVISYGDLAIRKGMMMVYNLEELSKKDFDRISKLYSPYSSVASLYLWEASGGRLPEDMGRSFI